tara:strand:- start:2241 stop:2387 length:147 start_codon:yes stop_codon:yes gene_type:complete
MPAKKAPASAPPPTGGKKMKRAGTMAVTAAEGKAFLKKNCKYLVLILA